MGIEIGTEIIKASIGLFFALIQVGTVALFAGAFKVWSDVKDLQRDMDAAFTKVRALEEELHPSVSAPKAEE